MCMQPFVGGQFVKTDEKSLLKQLTAVSLNSVHWPELVACKSICCTMSQANRGRKDEARIGYPISEEMFHQLMQVT